MSWKCKNCGKCCISLTERKIFILPLRKEDIPRLKEVQKFNELVKSGRLKIAKGTYDYDTKTFPKQLEAEGLCPFFDKEKCLCQIYEFRPSICRNFDCDVTNV
jgi:Fe-S-cluster containining protein